MIRTAYITRRFYHSGYDDVEEKELLFHDLKDALVFLNEKGFRETEVGRHGENVWLTFKHEENKDDYAFIDTKTADWVTAKEAKERGLEWNED